MDVEQRARELLARCLDEWGHPCEAENIREGEDLESYESELRLISQLLYFGMDTADGHGRAALTPPEGFVLVPVEPTEAMLRAGGWVEPPDAHGQDYIEKQGAAQCWKLMMDARPEVKP